jgi:hypothetical protein
VPSRSRCRELSQCDSRPPPREPEGSHGARCRPSARGSWEPLSEWHLDPEPSEGAMPGRNASSHPKDRPTLQDRASPHQQSAPDVRVPRCCLHPETGEKGGESLSARARVAGFPLGVPTMVGSKIASHAEEDRSSIGGGRRHDVHVGCGAEEHLMSLMITSRVRCDGEVETRGCGSGSHGNHEEGAASL